MMPQSARLLTIACPTQASSSFGRLSKRVWQSHLLRLSTKIQIYRAVVFPTLLYGADLGSLSEADQATGAVSPALLALHPLHQMARPRVERRSPQESQPAQDRVHLISETAALDWPRHKNTRMEDVLMPEAVFFSEFQEGKRDRGAQRKRYKDRLKRQLAQAGISHQSWQQ